MNELIVVKQLPIIKERLKEIQATSQEQVNNALALLATEDTVKDIKKVRADLTKTFNELEAQRLAVKKAILAPYEEFELVYKECVSNVFKPADSKLKSKIDEIETDLKNIKVKDVEGYFYEYAISKGVDFINFRQAKINVTLSASLKSLKEAGKAFIDNIADGLAVIETLNESQLEVRAEFVSCLNLNQAISTVNERLARLEREKQRQLEMAERARQAEENRRRIEEVVKKTEAEEVGEAVEVTAPTVEEAVEEVQAEPIFTMTFTVIGTREQLKKIKTFIESEGIKYE